MINCHQFKATLSQYIDRDISLQGRRSFEEHLQNCPRCQRIYQSVLNTKNSMNQFAEVSVSDDFINRLQARILATRNAQIEDNLKKGSAFRRIPSFAYGFAMALIAVIIGFYLMEFHPGSLPAQAPPQIVQEKIRQKSTLPSKQPQDPPVLPNRGQLVNTENSADSSVQQDSRTPQPFDGNIKTVKKEY
ncbi:MAG: anti-sigma factor family protein [Fidelibacterota bacterium]